MPVNEAQIAPDFEMNDINNNLVKLSDFKGKKILITFMRYAGCPFCNIRVNQLIEKYPLFQEKGLDIIAFYESPASSIRKYTSDQNFPFTVIADPHLKVYNIYDVRPSWSGYLKGAMRIGKLYKAVVQNKFMPGKVEGEMAMIPADFLLNPDLSVYKAHYGKDITDHLPIGEIEKFIEKN